MSKYHTCSALFNIFTSIANESFLELYFVYDKVDRYSHSDNANVAINEGHGIVLGDILSENQMKFFKILYVLVFSNNQICHDDV